MQHSSTHYAELGEVRYLHIPLRAASAAPAPNTWRFTRPGHWHELLQSLATRLVSN